MRVIVNNTTYTIADSNVLTITFCINPIVDAPTRIAATMEYDPKDRKYHTDVNPSRIIQGPLSNTNEPLTGDLGEEWDLFIDDCRELIKAVGFVILDQDPEPQSPKSHYFIVYGMKDNPFGLIVFDLRVSDHPNSDITFPVDSMEDAYEKLIANRVIDPHITMDDIMFPVANVIVGTSKHSNWDQAFNRVYLKLQQMKRKVITRKKVYEEFKLSYVPIAVTSDNEKLSLPAHLISHTACVKQFEEWEDAGYDLVEKCIKIYEGKQLRDIEYLD